MAEGVAADHHAYRFTKPEVSRTILIDLPPWAQGRAALDSSGTLAPFGKRRSVRLPLFKTWKFAEDRTMQIAGSAVNAGLDGD